MTAGGEIDKCRVLELQRIAIDRWHWHVTFTGDITHGIDQKTDEADNEGNKFQAFYFEYSSEFQKSQIFLEISNEF